MKPRVRPRRAGRVAGERRKSWLFVEAMEPRRLLATFLVDSNADSGPGTLREAITNANALPGADVINFNLPAGSLTISVTSALPSITDALAIDGTTQVGFGGTPIVELSGAQAPAGTSGLVITGNNSVVRGLVINQFKIDSAGQGGQGIVLQGGNNRVSGNYIGTDVTGTVDLGNQGSGVIVLGADNLVGGTDPADRNVISGNGSVFAAPVNQGVGERPIAIANGLFDFDDSVDLVTANMGPSGGDSSISVLLGNPDGTYQPALSTVIVPGVATSLTTGDFFLDGVDDVVVTTFDGLVGRTFLLVANGDGTFQAPQLINSNNNARPTGVTVGRFNQDNDFFVDLAVANDVGGGGQDFVTVLLGNGDGTFQPATTFNAGPDPSAIASLGFGGFGANLVVSNAGNDTISVFLSNSDGTFTTPPTNVAVGASPSALGVADFTSDGRVDIVVANRESDNITIVVQSATGGFSVFRTIAVGDGPSGVALGDFDGDSRTDIAVANTAGDSITLIVRGGQGSLRPAMTIPAGQAPAALISTQTAFSQGIRGLAVVNRDDNNVGVYRTLARHTAGVQFLGTGAMRNQVQGNFIGLNAAGTAALSNTHEGVRLDEAANNVIGGLTNTPGTGAGNVISGNDGNGIEIAGAGSSNNTVQGNLLGLNPAGSAAMSNAGSGVRILTAASNLIGGASVLARNVISGNLDNGIRVNGEFNATFDGTIDAPNNVIQGNFIGSDISGTVDIGNFGHGIAVNLASGTRIGGPTTTPGAAPGNVIVGNTVHGIDIRGASFIANSGGSDGVIQGNIIGLDVTGTTAIRNDGEGIVLDNAPRNLIGGTTPQERNIISGNGDDGIAITSVEFNPNFPPLQVSSENIVQGNYIGTDITGMLARPNGSRAGIIGAGIFIADSPNNTIGGTTSTPGTGPGNVISGNMIRGLLISRPSSNGNVVAGNLIGVAADGVTPLGNTQEGTHFLFTASNNTIGGTDPGARNIIANNGTTGITVDSATGIVILNNSIFQNGAEGILLVNGGNANQVAPTLVSATSTGLETTVAFTIQSVPNRAFRIQFSSDPAGTAIPQGQTILGSIVVTTDSAGFVSDTATFPVGLPNGSLVTAIAIDQVANNTSAFSNAVSVSAAADPFVVTNTNDSGEGSLRQVILNANNAPGLNTITFNISGAGVQTISPLTQLPDITDPVIIDGYSQPLSSPNTNPVTLGSNANILIELSGSNLTGFEDGLTILAGGSTVRGLAINRFQGNGVLISGPGGNLIVGNAIGTDPAGTVALGNGFSGIEIDDSSNNLVGGLNPADRNIISGNVIGVRVFDTSLDGDTTANMIQGNFIGTDASGTIALDGGRVNASGVGITASGNLVGGGSTQARNVISGQTAAGVVLIFSDNTVAGNLIGTQVDGISPLGNQGNGVIISSITGLPATDNVIGGTFSGGSNVIAFNGGAGVRIGDAITVGNSVLSNSIFGNGGLGIELANGANRNQPAPSLTSASQVGSSVEVPFTLNAAPLSAFLIEFFSNPPGTPSPEGQTLIGSTIVNTDSLGTFSGTVSLLATLPPGTAITATATNDALGDTSQFSNAVLIGGAADPFVVTNTNDSGEGSLRQAILNANDALGLNTITFNISGAGIQTIAPLTALPDILDPVIIDATTQPGFAGSPIVELSGSNTSGVVDGLVVLVGQSTIRGFIINNFDGDGIQLNTGGNNTIVGNWIGLNSAGTAAAPNGTGIRVMQGSSHNTIGGLSAADRNVVSGSVVDGVLLQDVGTDLNTIVGNYIGTNATGTAAIGNGGVGVGLGSAADSAKFGVTNTQVLNNVISGNNIGVGIGGTGTDGNHVRGNLIGTNAAGTARLGNIAFGIIIESGATDNTIGGPLDSDTNVIVGTLGVNGAVGDGIYVHVSSGNTIENNVISGNRNAGVHIEGDSLAEAASNLVMNNRIGTNADGTAADPNQDGVFLDGAGENIVTDNLISGNRSSQVQVFLDLAFGNEITHNRIGTNAAGTATLVPLNIAVNTVGIFINQASGTFITENTVAGQNQGILIFDGATENLVESNKIGTDIEGIAPLPNNYGVFIFNATANTVANNVISGNLAAGVRVTGGLGNTIEDNFIGTNADGDAAIGNGRDGVFLQGHGNLVRRNVISGNGSSGVQVFEIDENVIEDNVIGLNATATAPVPNGRAGVFLNNAFGNTIRANVISGNTRVGLQLAGSGTVNNVITLNKIGTDPAGVVQPGFGNAFGVFDNLSGTNEFAADNIVMGNGQDFVAGAGTPVTEVAPSEARTVPRGPGRLFRRLRPAAFARLMARPRHSRRPR